MPSRSIARLLPITFCLVIFCLASGPGVRADSVEVVLASSVPEAELACTWRTPDDGAEAPRPFPAAILLTVAGPDDRDQTIGPHKPFADLADGLATAGIASLRCDDHGVGASTGDWLQASYRVRAQDAVRMAEWTRSQPGVDPSGVGFIGNSEGGAIGPLASLRMGEAPPAFVVLLAGPAVPIDELFGANLERAIETRGIAADPATHLRALYSRLLTLMMGPEAETPVDPRDATGDLRQRVLAFLEDGGGALIPPYAFVPREREALADFLLSPWYRSQFTYRPHETLSQLTVPTLALVGSLDTVLPPYSHVPALRAALTDARHQVVVLEGLNHLFQKAKTGSPLEYPLLPGGFSPRAIDEVKHFVLALAQGDSESP